MAMRVAPTLALILLPALVGAEPIEYLKARHIGPAAMSGRVTAVVADPTDPRRITVGGASSGVWRSTDGGLTWSALFADQPFHSIGALALDPQSPEVIWVGTGEGNTRNSVSIGGGVYRSSDGGKSWQALGLDKSERINKIVVHPADSNTVWVAALGPLWSDGDERGVYKTSDGGATWRQVLSGGDQRTGASDLTIDPKNPNVLWASTWSLRREPDLFTSGGPNSGLWRSTDGGETWTRLGPKQGLPKGDLGRTAIAIAPSDPRVVYALIEAKDSVLLRSTDGGVKFETVNSSTNIHPRPFYFGELYVDPLRPDRLYKLAVVGQVSDDGGKSFSTLIGWDDLHPDHHALWVEPARGELLIAGNDGGIGISYDRGETWRFVENLPFAQFYHVTVDREFPYRIYGGLQDNGSWQVPSRVFEYGPIRNHHARETHFGDGFDSAADPENPDRGYAMSQQGYIVRFDLNSHERKLIRPAADVGGPELRFNWNAAFAQDPFDAGTIWFGSQFVHRSTDRGETWQTLSADLTSNDPKWQRQAQSGGLTPDVTGAENLTTLIAIEPSRIDSNVIWTGSDDGRVHVSRDDGQSWTRVDTRAPRSAAKDAFVPHISASPFDPAVAYLVLDNHRRGDFATYIYRLDDYGQKWTALATDGVRGYAHKLLPDMVERQLLWLGTEFGLYFSVDGGDSWRAYGSGIPTSSVMDLAIQPDEHDLVVATHGHGIYIVDDIRALRRLAAEGKRLPKLWAEAGDGTLVPMSPHNRGGRFPGNDAFAGENEGRNLAVTIHVDASLVDDSGTKLQVLIRDSQGVAVRSAEVEVKAGFNRWRWAMDSMPARSPTAPPPWASPTGIDVLPGDYTVEVSVGEQKASAIATVRADPRRPLADAELQARRQALLDLATLQNDVVATIERNRALITDLKQLKSRIETAQRRERELDPTVRVDSKAPPAVLVARIDEAVKAVEKAELALWQDPEKVKGYTADTDAWNAINVAEWSVGSSMAAPTAASLAYIELARTRTASAQATMAKVVEAESSAVRRAAAEQGLNWL